MGQRPFPMRSSVHAKGGDGCAAGSATGFHALVGSRQRRCRMGHRVGDSSPSARGFTLNVVTDGRRGQRPVSAPHRFTPNVVTVAPLDQRPSPTRSSVHAKGGDEWATASATVRQALVGSCITWLRMGDGVSDRSLRVRRFTPEVVTGASLGQRPVHMRSSVHAKGGDGWVTGSATHPYALVASCQGWLRIRHGVLRTNSLALVGSCQGWLRMGHRIRDRPLRARRFTPKVVTDWQRGSATDPQALVNSPQGWQRIPHRVSDRSPHARRISVQISGIRDWRCALALFGTAGCRSADGRGRGTAGQGAARRAVCWRSLALAGRRRLAPSARGLARSLPGCGP